MQKSQLTGKDSDAGKDWGQEEKGVTEDEIVGGHHPPSGHDFEQTLRDSEGQGSLECCSSWGHKESDMTAIEQHRFSMRITWDHTRIQSTLLGK